MKYLFRRIAVVLAVMILALGIFMEYKSTKGLKDGFYTAEMAEYHYGWIEYLIIQVKNDKIVSAEYNARNESGFVKSWDNAYMKNMMPGYGTYPNKYTREYVQQLIDSQVNTKVDVITGATSSGKNFEKLVAAVLKQAATGNSATVVVE
ncbi:MAG: FMN-binding protein [Lachnospiraceae bacterium]|jgi:major membrane immunogen (membrane-anchored lipoprotein)|nr:FMN-binding protein [Lachnospiraceae bacterium]HBV83823.1 FMN-binding protein [Lachnospiraceae bacterium]